MAPETSPAPVPGTPPPPTDAAGAKADTSSGQDLILKIVGAIGTGVGVLGFVTLFGGAILWIRAEQANLPANDAVAVVPNSVLVATGASFLVPAVLLAMLAVTIIYLVHLGFYAPRRYRQRNAFDHARLLNRQAEKLGRDAEAKTKLAQAARALATSLAEMAEKAKQDPNVPNEVKEGMAAAAEAQRLKAEEEEAAALAGTSGAAEMKASADNLQAEAQFALERTRKQFGIELGVGAAALLLLPPLVNGAIFNAEFGEVLVLVLVAVAAALVSLATYVATDKFVWFGVVAFITVGIYIGFATYFSTTGNPKVEPAAALRGDHPPVVGVFIADTASNLYMGSFPETGKPTRLMVIPRAQVTDLAIGPLLDRDKARSRAIALALDHCRLKISKPAPAPKTEGESPPSGSEQSVEFGCSNEEETELRALLG